MVTFEDKQAFINHCRDDPVFFAESLLISESGKPYKLEDHQKEFLRCQDPHRMLFWARRLSKSTTIRFDILHKATFISSMKCLGIVPSQSQANDFGGEIRDMVNRSEFLDDIFIKKNITAMQLQNNSRINLATAGGEGISQLGRGARYLFFDEAQQIPDSVYGFLIPIIRGQPGKKYQVYSGTPLGKIGNFWEVYNDAKMILHDGEVTKVEVEYENEAYVVFQRQTAYLDDEGNIVKSGTKRISIEELEADRRRMTEVEFLREYVLQWMDTIGEVFPVGLINSVMDSTVKPKMSSPEECVAGLDLGKARNNSVLTVGERKNNGKVDIVFIKSFPLETEYKDIANYVTRSLPQIFPNIRKLMVDQTGVGEAVVEQINGAAPYKVEGYNFAGPTKKKALVESGVLDLEQGKIKIIYNQQLFNEMIAFKREFSEKSSQFLYSKPAGGSDDFVDSLLLCLAANRNTIGAIGEFNVMSIGNKVFDYVKDRTRSRASTGDILKNRGIYK